MLLDVGGQDATEAFEDVGHSDEAREILDGLIVGKLKRVVRLYITHIILLFCPLIPIHGKSPFSLSPQKKTNLQSSILKTNLNPSPTTQEGDPAPKAATTTHVSAGPKDTSSSSSTTSLGIGLYAGILVSGVLAFVAYRYMQANEQK